MTAVHSARWYRVAELRPRLVSQLRVRRQRVRGETWIVVSSAAGGRTVRLSAPAWQIAARLDGTRTVQQLWERALGSSEDPPTQDELIDLLAQLREAALLQFDRAADFELLLPHLDRVARPRGRNTLLAWRFPLANPSAPLDRLHGLGRLLFSRTMLWIWLAAVATLLVLAVQHGPALWAHGRTWLATPRFALLAALLYVPIKLLHELAHGLAVHRWGGRVREAGITLMVGLPVPYVDASAASGFVERRRRLAVGVAGIAAELAIASLALPLWLWLDDGLARDAAFVTLFVTGVSALLFNANPLQRLDGYYIFTDALDLPNLAPRSRRWWTEMLRRRLLRLPADEAMPVARGEARWLAAYAPLSWLMMMFIATLAIAWLGAMSLALGVVAGLVLLWQIGLRPVHRLFAPLRRAALAQSGSMRRWRRAALAATAVLAAVLLLPLPQRTLVQGVVWPPDQAQLRSDEDGFVASVAATDGAQVEHGTLVLELSNPKLQTDLQRQAARVSALEAELFGALPGAARGGEDKRAGDARAELSAAQGELEHLQQRVQALAVRAQASGRLALPAATDLAGRFVPRGRLLGQVLTNEAATVRVALPESQAQALRETPRAVSVRLASEPGRFHQAQLLRDSVGAVRQLPSAALSDRHGGDIATDPSDREALQPLHPVVLLDVQLDAAPGETAAASGRLGERAWVRFDTGFAPLALQLTRALQRELLKRFNPSF